jgi:hypothetical protein
MRTIIHLAALWLSCLIWIWVAGCVGHQGGKTASVQPDSYKGPLIDAHAHYTPGAVTIDGVIKLLDRSGVDRIALMAEPEVLSRAVEKYPDRIIPFLSPYVYYKMAGEKQMTQQTLELAAREISTGSYRGFGEHLLRLHPIHFAPDGVHVSPAHPVMLKVYDLAARNAVPVTVHVDAPYHEELSQAAAHNRKTQIIWAHCGYGDHPLIRRMFETHPNLYGDLSVIADATKSRHREITDSRGVLLPEWKSLFEDYSNRLMVGSDMGAKKQRYQKTVQIMNAFRKILGQLSDPAAENIGYRTIASLVDR